MKRKIVFKGKTYKSKFTEMTRKTTFLKALLMVWLFVLSHGALQAATYVFHYETGGNSHFLAHVNNQIADVTVFDAATCLWTGPDSGNGKFSYLDGETTYYLHYASGLTINTSYNSTTWTVNGERIYYRYSNTRYYYIRFTGTRWEAANNNTNNTVLRAVDEKDHSETMTEPFISGADMVHELGVENYSASTVYHTPGYAYYHFTHGGQQYDFYLMDGVLVPQAPQPSAEGIVYEWTLSNDMDNDARIVDNQGQNISVDYYSAVPTVKEAVLTCVASFGETSSSSRKTITYFNPDMLEKPVISYTHDNPAIVTLSHETSGVSIYYTINGPDPDVHNGTLYVAPFQAPIGSMIRAIAVKDGYLSSLVAVEKVDVNSGVFADKVVLNDMEDHTWSYYSDASLPVHSLHPADVEIVYRGNGGFVGVDHPNLDTYEYWETLETEDAAYPYRYEYATIPNPFSKRPKNGNDYQGFAQWRVKTLLYGSIKDANNNTIAEGGLVDAESKIYFVPNSEDLRMMVEFEAVWTKAYVVTCTASELNNLLASSDLRGDSYETNFIIVTGGNSATNLTAANAKKVTISMVMPDGSTDYRNANCYIRPQTVTLSNDCKFEYLNMNDNTTTITANNHNLVMGRGVANTAEGGVCANLIQGINGGTSANLNYTIRLESGIFNYLSYVRGYVSGSQISANCTGDANSIKGVLGNDLDRATNDNSLLKIRQEMIMGYRPTFSQANRTRETFRVVAKSGDFCSEQNNNIADAHESFYISLGGVYANNVGRRVLIIEGGQFLSIAGGIDEENPADAQSVYIRMKGGNVRGSIYGAAAFAAASGDRKFVITGGKVHGWVAGGCNGTDNNQSGGTLASDTYLYIGGNAEINSDGSTTPINISLGGNVFGAGSGNANQPVTGQVNSTNVIIADDAFVERNVYGGGNLGYSLETANVTVKGGKVFGKVFGGSNQKQGNEVVVTMTGGVVREGVFGGSNVTGTISGNVAMNILGGEIGVHAMGDRSGNVHGGGYGAPTRVMGNIDMTFGSGNSYPVIHGDVYGGSALGLVNGEAPDASKHTFITIQNAHIHGNVYGGGLGDDLHQAHVFGEVKVTVNDGVFGMMDDDSGGSVFGCNNINGAPQNAVSVNVNGGTIYNCVYGGGNQAGYGGSPLVNVAGGHVYRSVFGAGLGREAKVDGATTVTITGAQTQIDEHVFGGGQEGSMMLSSLVSVADARIGGSVYGGGLGNEAEIGRSTTVTVDGAALVAGNVYGGGDAGDVVQTATVTVKGTAQVNDVFGAGKGTLSDVEGLDLSGKADPATTTFVTIGERAVVKGSVYGGAEEGSVRLASDDYAYNTTKVNVENGRVGHNVYGGGKLGLVGGRTIVNMKGGTVEGNVFGGALGRQGTVLVAGLKTVNMTGGLVQGNVYGGSQNSNDTVIMPNPADDLRASAIFVNISGGQIGENVYGGGFYGTITGSVTVNIGKNAILNSPDNQNNVNKPDAESMRIMPLNIEGSVYAGSDWGEIVVGGTFGPQNISGYSNIYVDGSEYDMQAPVNHSFSGNYMNIGGSIYGAGTSSDAGKSGRRIWIRNYGLDTKDETDTYSVCTRTLYTIQRADSVFLENSHITFLGQGDMTSVLATERYGIMYVFSKLRLVNNSTIDLFYPADSLFALESMMLPEGKTLFNAITSDYAVVNFDQLTDNVTYNEKFYPLTDNKIRLDNGDYIAVKYPKQWNPDQTGNPGNSEWMYGELKGFFHMVYPRQYGFAFARPKVTTRENPQLNGGDYSGYWIEQNIYDGGFVSYRDANIFDAEGGNTTASGNYNEPVQGPYINHLPQNGKRDLYEHDREFYRFWEVRGDAGYNWREGVFDALSNGNNNVEYQVTTCHIELPPMLGKYFKITRVDWGDDFAAVDAAKISQNAAGNPNANWIYFDETATNPNAQLFAMVDSLYYIDSEHTKGVPVELEKINSLPNNTFGLSIKAEGSIDAIQHFDGTQWVDSETDMLLSVGTVSDEYFLNNHRFSATGDITKTPIFTFQLTYSNQLSRNAVLAPVIVVVDQFDDDGNVIYSTEIELVVNTITNIRQSFDQPLYALMFGNGEKNEVFSAKAALPPYAILPGQTSSTFRIAKIEVQNVDDEKPFNLVSMEEFANMQEPDTMTVAMRFGPALTYDNTQGWLSGYENSNPEASLHDVKALMENENPAFLNFILGEADGRSSFGLQFDLFYNGMNFVRKNELIGKILITIEFDNYEEGQNTSFDIAVLVNKRGKATNWYIDGVNGLNTNDGHFADLPKHSLNGVISAGYAPGDNVFVVDKITVSNYNASEWDGSGFGSQGITLYRYSGGHQLSSASALDPGQYKGVLVDVESELAMFNIKLDGLNRVSGRVDEALNPQGLQILPEAPLMSVENNGELSVNNTYLIDNYNLSSTVFGGGVWVKSGAVMNVNGGSVISENRVSNAEGGGVYLDGILNVKDNVSITDNVKSGGRSNVYLANVEQVINIDKSFGLTENSVIGITKNDFPMSPADPTIEWDYTPIALSDKVVMAEQSYANGVFYDDQGIYAVYYDAQNLDLSSNTIYFVKTWVTVIKEQPETFVVNGSDPISITCEEDLAWLISYVNGYNGSQPHATAKAILTENVDMNEHIWVPIGNSFNKFSGVFDGNGYEISGLRNAMTGIDAMGLFGYVSGASTEVKNTFALSGTMLSPDRAYMGSIAGVVINGAKVYGCEGALTLIALKDNTIMGGLVGLLDGNSVLHSSISVANLQGFQMGGLVGEARQNASVMNCYAYSKFVGNEENAFPMAGLVADNAATIRNCYLRIRKENRTNRSAGRMFAFTDRAGEGASIDKCYYFIDDDFVGMLTNEPTPMSGCDYFYEARHPYTYAENYNRIGDEFRGAYLVDILNENAQTIGTEMLPWTRTTSDINDDYPVLKMSNLATVASRSTDSVLYYNHNLNEAFARFEGESYDAIIAVYASNDEQVSVEQPDNVTLYVNEDVALLQDEASVLHAYVGITLDNSAGYAGANPGNGIPDATDWHMFATPLANAPLGINYLNDFVVYNWWDSNYTPFGTYPFYEDDDASGYFPNDTPRENYDFYCYYEPQYHWINFKRNGVSHWHEDENAEGKHEWIAYGYTDQNNVYQSAGNDEFSVNTSFTNEPELIAGKGYLLAIKDESYLQAFGTMNNGEIQYVDVTKEGAHCPGLNLLGNPYQSYLDFKAFADENSGTGKIWSSPEKAFYTLLDEDKSGYVTYAYDASWNESNYTASRFVNMHQGFFVITQDNTAASFTNAMRSAKGFNTSFRGDNSQPSYPLVNLILTESTGNKEYAIVELGRPEAGGAEKIKTLKNGVSQLYAHYNNHDYSIAFTTAGETSVPIRFKTDEYGTFTLTWNTQNGTFSYLHLIDNQTGMDIDCLNADNYKFTASPDDYVSRFKLVFSYTGVDENSDTELIETFAFFDGNNLIVNGKGRMDLFDVQGHCLLSTDLYGAQNSVNVSRFSSGLYFIRLTDGQRSVNQKIIISR